MNLVSIESHEHANIIRLNNGPTNSLTAKLVAELAEALAHASQDDKGLVLAGGEKFFSIGLDLPQVLNFDRPAMEDYWRRFEQLQLDLLTMDVPTACAIRGHATAGGMILSLTTDLRLVAEGKTLMGLNELHIGIMVPYLTHLMLEHRLGTQKAIDMEYSGRFISPDVAKKLGYAEEVLPSDQVEQRALELVSKMAQIPRKAFIGSKDGITRFIQERFMALRDEKEQVLLDSWFDEGTQALLREAAKKF